MPENSEELVNDTQGAPAEEVRTFTQEEVDSIVGERLKRERAKYDGFDEFKAKAAKFDEMEQANKSELEKLVEERDKLRSENETMKAEREREKLIAKVVAETGVDAETLSRMSGDVEENAAFLKERMDKAKYPTVPDYGEVKPPSAKKTEIPTVF